MRHRLNIAGVTALSLVLSVVAMSGQDTNAPPPQQPDDNWHYQSPGPARCVEVGDFYLHKGKLPAALSRFQEAIRINPHYAPAYIGLGKVYEKMGQKQKALTSYRQYLDELPSDKDAEQAKAAQRAIARLQQEIGPSRSPTPRP